LGIADRVVLMTFSEFGRRVNQNSSGGTDHGTAAPLFVIGHNVNGGIYGDNPDLTDLDNAGDIKHHFDYRQIYASLLVGQLAMPPERMPEVLTRGFSTLPLISASTTYHDKPLSFKLHQNYPNPFNPTTSITYNLRVPLTFRLEVFSAAGDRVATLFNGHQDVGSYTVQFDGSKYPSGVYFATLESGVIRETVKMMLIK
jgi:hypothetical protein